MLISDRATGLTWDFYLTQRVIDVLLNTLTDFLRYLEAQYGVRVKYIECDNELPRHHTITHMLMARGIQMELSASNTQAQNGGAERIAAAIKERARTMAIDAKLPDVLWPEVVTAATYLYNRTPSAARNWKTPYQLFYEHFWRQESRALARPDLSHLRSYGCKAYAMTADVQLHRNRKRKLAPRAWIGFLVGYSSSNSYCIWNPLRGEVFTTRDVVFNEKRYFNGNIRGLVQEIQYIDLEAIQNTLDKLI